MGWNFRAFIAFMDLKCTVTRWRNLFGPFSANCLIIIVIQLLLSIIFQRGVASHSLLEACWECVGAQLVFAIRRLEVFALGGDRLYIFYGSC